MNLPTILVLCAVVAICATIILLRIRAKKQGKIGCSCGCGGCAMRELCHKDNEQKKEN